ncbi:hypothetical protein AVEN_176642-1 [Araneus ventricosus]|uniref:RNA-directed DNA polymerase from mobile element jockey n=1 Tax=Araneus ventricosus TaxID=182803 RepID=A0A4Y2L3X1_ARAVE|nr:hypothetical protein AVEN_176642-1 [Araneus ventricosus]
MDNVHQWCKHWRLNISPEKCAMADLSRRRMTSHPDIYYAGVPLPWKTEIKYLGFIFSKTNQNNINIKYLRTKVRRKINALKSIAYKTHGPRTKDLISIVNNSICSLFFYNCSTNNKWSATHLKICDVIQTTALRTAMGLPIWTPDIILLKLAAQGTLSGKIKRLATQFFLKHIAYGVHSPLYRNDGTQSVKLTNKDSSALGQLLSDFNIDRIIKLPNTWDCPNIKCKIHLQSFLFQDKSLPKTTIETLFEDTIRTNFSNFFLIATDAFKSPQITSIAGTSISNSFAYRLQHINSFFSAEALALC